MSCGIPRKGRTDRRAGNCSASTGHTKRRRSISGRVRRSLHPSRCVASPAIRVLAVRFMLCRHRHAAPRLSSLSESRPPSGRLQQRRMGGVLPVRPVRTYLDAPEKQPRGAAERRHATENGAHLISDPHSITGGSPEASAPPPRRPHVRFAQSAREERSAPVPPLCLV
jgi:hypothetical protein